MTIAYADARPPGLNVPFRPGNTLHLELTGWTAGSLVGRTFTSTLGGVALSLAVVGDIITIDATEAQTAAVTLSAAWLLTETTSGASNDLIVGTWSPSTRPGTPTSTSLAVTVGAVDVDVTVVSGQASIVALDAELDAHVAGQGVHGWTLDGTTIRWSGAIQTNHDAKYFEADRIRSGTAAFVDNAGTLAAPPLWQFDQTTVERIKWLWTPGDDWDSYVVRLGWMNTALASGNVRWRYYERRTVVNAGNPTGNWTTAPTQVAEITSAAPSLDANKYEDLAVAVPTEPLTVVMSVIERITTGVSSPLAADAGIYLVTATRT